MPRAAFRSAAVATAVLATVLATAGPCVAQPLQASALRISTASRLDLPGDVDSNSPVVWDLDEGQSAVTVFTSFDGIPSRSTGPSLTQLGQASPVTIWPQPPGGVWFEAVVTDDDDTWYAYFHNEVPADVCGRPDRVVPRIGAAKSTDRGLTWRWMGTIFELPPDSLACGSSNRYFLGGAGDFSAVLDHDSRYLYFFISQYPAQVGGQGVAIGRMAWAARDFPVGHMRMWNGSNWEPATFQWTSTDPSAPPSTMSRRRFQYPVGDPIYPAGESLHDSDSVAEAFWGPSVHWNSYLQMWVMLLNHTDDTAFDQEGIYLSYSPSLEDPTEWSRPVRLLNRTNWYPQVIGLEPGVGTDKVAGQTMRLFVGGTSVAIIGFNK